MPGTDTGTRHTEMTKIHTKILDSSRTEPCINIVMIECGKHHRKVCMKIMGAWRRVPSKRGEVAIVNPGRGKHLN